MKKLLFLLFAAAAFAACNDDDGAPKIRYASTNDGIIDGHLQGINMFFYGSAVATDDAGNAYTDDEALFEFAGGAPRAIRNTSPSTCTRPASQPACRPSK